MSEIKVMIDGKFIGDLPAFAVLISDLEAEIARLREERKPVAWCVQAAAGTLVRAGTHAPIDVVVFIS